MILEIKYTIFSLSGHVCKKEVPFSAPLPGGVH
jgi:hypothetical protein